MSRTIKGSKKVGADFWSRTSSHANGTGPIAKRIGNNRQRTKSKAIVKNELNIMEKLKWATQDEKIK